MRWQMMRKAVSHWVQDGQCCQEQMELDPGQASAGQHKEEAGEIDSPEAHYAIPRNSKFTE